MNEYTELRKKAESIRKMGLAGMIACFTVIGIVVSIVLQIICCVKIQATDWKNERLNKDKFMYGAFTVLLIGMPIIAMLWARLVENTLPTEAMQSNGSGSDARNTSGTSNASTDGRDDW